jgi:gluconokinase
MRPPDPRTYGSKPRSYYQDGTPEKHRGETPQVVILMGVAGSGKTTVGQRLASSLGWPFFDADNFHPAANVEKMSHGVPLTDEDRRPWLASLRELIASRLGRGEHGESAVLACSALKESYRETLSGGDPRARFVYLEAGPALLSSRLEHRPPHFFAAGLLDSQLATLEEPRDAIRVDASRTPEELVAEIRQKLGI